MRLRRAPVFSISGSPQSRDESLKNAIADLAQPGTSAEENETCLLFPIRAARWAKEVDGYPLAR